MLWSPEQERKARDRAVRFDGKVGYASNSVVLVTRWQAWVVVGRYV